MKSTEIKWNQKELMKSKKSKDINRNQMEILGDTPS